MSFIKDEVGIEGIYMPEIVFSQVFLQIQGKRFTRNSVTDLDLSK